MVLLIILSLIFTSPLFPKTHTLKNRLQKANGGEFIVTEKDKILTLLTYHRPPSGDRIILEEISAPKNCISFPNHWQSWIDNYAPGHHSWTLYEIDSDTGALISCFSPSKGEWLSIHGETEFLVQLLNLPLEEVSDLQKKRIGPAPEKRSEDHRPLWAPILIYEGKAQGNAYFDVYETFWPSDETALSLARLTLYFHKQNASFPFPYWMQVETTASRAKVRVIDSGSELHSIFVDMPKRNLVCSDFEKDEHGLYRLSVTCRLPCDTFRLYAVDRAREGIRIPLSFSRVESENGYLLTVSKEEMERVLLKDHFYYFMVIPLRYSNEFAKTARAWHYIP